MVDIVELHIPEKGSHEKAWEAYNKLTKVHDDQAKFKVSQSEYADEPYFRVSGNWAAGEIKTTSALRVEHKMAEEFTGFERRIQNRESKSDKLEKENRQLQQQNQELREELSQVKTQMQDMQRMMQQLSQQQGESDSSETNDRIDEVFEDAGLDEPELD